MSSPLHILLLEDNEDDVFLFRRHFMKSSIPIELHIVKDGEAALDFLFQRRDFVNAPRPAVFLVDLNVPRKSGQEVLQQVKANPDTATIPCWVLIGSIAQQAYLVKRMVADEFVEKDPARILKKILALSGANVD
jgi:CheY-like chemotaxis protein